MIRALLICAIVMFLVPARSSAAINVSFGHDGLDSIRYAGSEYLKDGRCVVRKIDLQGASGAQIPAKAGDAPLSVSSIGGSYVATRTYPWGSLTCTYSVSGDRLLIGISVNNQTNYAIHALWLQVVQLKAPMPSSEKVVPLTRSSGGLEGVTVFSIPYGGTKVLVVDEQLGKFLNLVVASSPELVSVVITTNLAVALMPTVSKEWKPRRVEIVRPIAPMGADRYSVALCFGKQSDPPRALEADVFKRFAVMIPPNFVWPDRRPIAQLILTSRNYNTPPNPLNPRYWRMVKPGVDVNSEAGRKEFQRNLLEATDEMISLEKKMNAQGVIVWDIEGAEDLSSVYVGDPRHLAPEMQGVVDRFFKRFTDNGLRCGVTLRPQRLVVPTVGPSYQLHSDDEDTMFMTLDEKIEFSIQRWGCTLFYIDSNGDDNWPIPASIFRRLVAKHPNILLIPEKGTLAYFASTAPYWNMHRGTPPSIAARAVYPKAFDVLSLNSLAPMTPGDALWQTLVQMVRSGDILLFPGGWWKTWQGSAVAQIYQEAYGPRSYQ